MGLKVPGVVWPLVAQGNIALGAFQLLGGAADDVGLARVAAGFWKVTDGSSGDGGLRVADGAAATPSLAFDNESNTGWFLRGAQSLGLSIVGTQRWELTMPGGIPVMKLGSTGVYGWTGSTPDAGADTVLGRSGAGIVGLYSAADRSTGAHLAMASDKKHTFSSTTDPDGTVDAALSRAAAGKIQVEDGAGADRDLQLRELFSGANRVVGARKTGWGAPTGTSTRTTFATSTVTTAQLAERVKALLEDLGSVGGHGLISTV